MDKKLQKQILLFIKETNEKNGNYIPINQNNLFTKFGKDNKVFCVFNFLKNEGFINSNKWESLIITGKGINFLKPWYCKPWMFFANDIFKLLSFIATILSIWALIKSFLK